MDRLRSGGQYIIYKRVRPIFVTRVLSSYLTDCYEMFHNMVYSLGGEGLWHFEYSIGSVVDFIENTLFLRLCIS